MNILLVGGSAESRTESLHALQLALGDQVHIKLVDSVGAARQELQSGQYQVLLDLGLADEARWRLLRLSRQLAPLTQVVLVLANDQSDQAVEALRQGASEVLLRNSHYPTLLPLLAERAHERSLLLEQHYQESLSPTDSSSLEALAREAVEHPDLTKGLEGARTVLRQIERLIAQSQSELTQRRATLRQAGRAVQRHERGLKALSQLTETISQSPDLPVILESVLDQALSMTAAEAGAVLVIDDESQPFRLAAQRGMPAEWLTALVDQQTGVGPLLTGIVSGRTLLIQDITHGDASPEVLTLLSQAGLNALLSIPLQTGGRLLGGLIVVSRHSDRLTPRETLWLQVVGQQAGIAIENAHLRARIWEAAESWFAQPAPPVPPGTASVNTQAEVEKLTQALDETKHLLRRREEALSAIINVIDTASYRPDVMSLLEETLRFILEESEVGGIWLMEESSGVLKPAIASGLPSGMNAPWPRQVWEQDDLLASLMSGQVVYMDAPLSTTQGCLLDHLVIAGARSVVGIPLQVQKESAGVMIVAALRPGQLQAHDAEQLTAIGQQLGQALERQRLYDERRRLALKLEALRQRKNSHTRNQEIQLSTLYEVNRLLAHDSTRTLKAGIKGAVSALEASGGLILLRDAAQGHLTLVHQVGLPGSFVDRWSLQPIEAQESLPAVPFETAQVIVYTERETQPRLLADLLDQDRIEGLVVVPLIPLVHTQGFFGALVLVFSLPASVDRETQVGIHLPLMEEQMQWLALLTQMMALSLRLNHGPGDSHLEIGAPSDNKKTT
ncbi:MAG: GAF domain-containing protein [Chloroflexota bacterium]